MFALLLIQALLYTFLFLRVRTQCTASQDCTINCTTANACSRLFVNAQDNAQNTVTVNCFVANACSNMGILGFSSNVGEVTGAVNVNCHVPGACTGYISVFRFPKEVYIELDLASGISSGPTTVTCGPGTAGSYDSCQVTCGEFCRARCDRGFSCADHPSTITCSGGAGPCLCSGGTTCPSLTISTQNPSFSPSFSPTGAPVISPTPQPSSTPSVAPTNTPTSLPSFAPTLPPSLSPSSNPTLNPTAVPTLAPSSLPSLSPSVSPTDVPTLTPSLLPTNGPSIIPSQIPSLSPSSVPSLTPSTSPSAVPSPVPTVLPSQVPSLSPSLAPSKSPSMSPTFVPSGVPSVIPTNAPTSSPSVIPSAVPSVQPTFSPSSTPSHVPSISPSLVPSSGPSSTPSLAPTSSPSIVPSVSPSSVPTAGPTSFPSSSPSQMPSSVPSKVPSISPSSVPSNIPSLLPTIAPTITPSNVPTLSPSGAPSSTPSLAPSHLPTDAPSIVPTLSPTAVPSDAPTSSPTDIPSNVPSVSPSVVPTMSPTKNPSSNPTKNPTSNPTITPTFGPVISLVEGNYSQHGGGILVNVTSSQAPITVQDVRRTRTATIQLTDAIELDANGSAVPGRQVNLAQGTWFERLNVNFTDYGGTVALADRLEYVTMAVLQNQRIRVDMTVNFFKEKIPSVIPCPGCEPLPVVGNAFKWSLKIRSWPFASSNHTLQINMLVIGSHPVNYTQTPLNGSLQATEITLGTVAIFSVAHKYVVTPPGNITKPVTISTRSRTPATAQTPATTETQAILSFNFSNFGSAGVVYDPLTEVLSAPIAQTPSQGSTSQSECTIIGINCIVFIIIVVILAVLIIICLVCLLCRRERKSPQEREAEENFVDDEGNPVGESVTRSPATTTKGGVLPVKSMSTESGPSVEMQSQTLGTPQGRAVSEESVDIAETEPVTAAPERGTSLPKRVNSESNDETTAGMLVTIKSEPDEDEKEAAKKPRQRLGSGYQKIEQDDERPRTATIGGGIGGGNVNILFYGWWNIDSQRRHVVFHSNYQMNVYGNQDANTLISVLDFAQGVDFEADVDNKTIVIHTHEGTRVFKSDQRADTKKLADVLEEVRARQAGDDYNI